MRILLALGEDALLRRDEVASAPHRRRNVEAAARTLARIASEHEVILTHSDGPQVGHMLELALRNELPERDVVSVLTEVVVDADDPAFRSLVPSPEPHAIAEIRSLRVLLDSGALVICADGSGIPVALDALGTMRGVEAMIDSDLTAALLARRLDADLLVMLTDFDAVHGDWHSPHDRSIAGAEVAELRAMSFDSCSIAPKVEAACRFAEATGRRAAIGSLRNVVRAVQGEAGTQVHAAAAEPAIGATRRLPRR
ncbi:MAG: amino acid kinase family protein [Solirubrobacterales bacterium]